MYSIFISYRRKDSKDFAKLLYERLKVEFDSQEVFMDTSAIRPGDLWPEEIKEALDSAEIEGLKDIKFLKS